MFKKTNFARVLNNIYFQRNEPVSLVHFITNRCNARCSFCFIDFDNPETFKGELTLEEIDKLTKNLGKSLLNVNFTGGEPFARKDILDIAKSYIKNSTIQSIYISTNASLPGRIEDFAKEISNVDSSIEQSFQISIDDLPERHNKVRKIKNLFDNCIDTYRTLKNMNIKNINPVVNITVSQENCGQIEEIYNYFTKECGINSLKACIVRDEGIYKTPSDKIRKIYDAYNWLTNKINNEIKNNNIINYNKNSIQGKIHQKKDIISYEMVKEMYLKPKFISTCHAGGLFGIITANGKVFPCEILEDKMMGDLREYDMNLMKIWKNSYSNQTRKYIKDTKCNCTYECALSYNILGNWRYQPSLLSSLFL
jgi:MoaA/NifB/PqqE/SkfB family radical SAM enzyme